MNTTPRLGLGDWLSFGASFAIVLALLLGLLHLLKRLRQTQSGGRPVRTINVLESQSIGPRQRLLVVRTRGSTFLLGVTPAQISLIGTLPDEDSAGDEPASSASSVAGPLAARLQSLLGQLGRTSR